MSHVSHNPPTYDEAVALVATDVRRSYPELSYREAVAHVVDTVRLVDVVSDDQLGDAYRVVLAVNVGPTRAELIQLVRLLNDEGVIKFSHVQRVWVDRIAGGLLT